MQTKDIGILLLIGLIIANLVYTSIPYTTNQFINQTTNLDYNSFYDGDYNSMVLVFDGNKISVADANDLNVALPNMLAYVKWVDGNNIYVIKSDLNNLIPKIGDINCSNGDKVIGYVEGYTC